MSDPTPGLVDPVEEKIVGKTHIVVSCMTKEAEPSLCPGWLESVDLDHPAHTNGYGEVRLPGYTPECDECGNPHDFEVNGVRLFFS